VEDTRTRARSAKGVACSISRPERRGEHKRGADRLNTDARR